MDILQRQWVLDGSYFPCKSKVYRKVLGIKIREYPRAERSRRCGMSRFPHWYSIHIVEPGVVTHNLPAAQLRLPPAVHTSPAHTIGTLMITGTGIFCRNVSYLSFFTGSSRLCCQKNSLNIRLSFKSSLWSLNIFSQFFTYLTHIRDTTYPERRENHLHQSIIFFKVFKEYENL